MTSTAPCVFRSNIGRPATYNRSSVCTRKGHPERSEGSLLHQILRCAQNDMIWSFPRFHLRRGERYMEGAPFVQLTLDSDSATVQPAHLLGQRQSQAGAA